MSGLFLLDRPASPPAVSDVFQHVVTSAGVILNAAQSRCETFRAGSRVLRGERLGAGKRLTEQKQKNHFTGFRPRL